jgi:hypothetical protein
MALLIQAGLADGSILPGYGDVPAGVHINSLTWQGHEFLDAIRNETVWAKTTATIKEKGGSLPFDVIRDTATSWVKSLTGLG